MNFVLLHHHKYNLLLFFSMSAKCFLLCNVVEPIVITTSIILHITAIPNAIVFLLILFFFNKLLVISENTYAIIAIINPNKPTLVPNNIVKNIASNITVIMASILYFLLNKYFSVINNDNVKYSAYEGVNYLGNTINNSSFTKQLTINLGNMNDSLLEFFDAEAISKKNKVSYSYEYSQLKENGYGCNLNEVDINDTIIVKSIKITPLERFEGIMFNENGEKDIYTGFQIELTTEPIKQVRKSPVLNLVPESSMLLKIQSSNMTT